MEPLTLHELPAEFALVPLAPCAAGALPVCVVVRRRPDPGHLVVLRDTFDARVLLGAVADAHNKLHAWLEVWVQAFDGNARRTAPTNSELDERWVRNCRAFDALPSGVLWLGWESGHPRPIFLDPQTFQPAKLPGGEWQLCTDDAVLSDKGLPQYGSTRTRFLFDTNDPTRLIDASGAAKTAAGTIALSELTGQAGLLPVNPTGGLMMVRPVNPMALESFVESLTSGKAPCIRYTKGTLPLLQPDGAVDGQSVEKGYLLPRAGKSGRLLETFHLKLRLLAGMIDRVRRFVAGTQRPILNLSANSFRVRFTAGDDSFPFLWTAEPDLVDPGDALRLELEGVEGNWFVRSNRRAEGGAEGPGTMRIREVTSDQAGVIVDGTLTPDEPRGSLRDALVQLRLSAGEGTIDLWARPRFERGLAADEWRVRTLPRRLEAGSVAALRSLQTSPTVGVWFETIPLLGPALDLRALAVLGARTLLADETSPLPVALDALFTLARRVGEGYTPAKPLPARIAAVFESDPRWHSLLGPHHLLAGLSEPEARQLLPAELWLATIALIVRMLPGMGPDSVCRSVSDVPPANLEQVFDPTVRELEKLLLHSKSLLLGDCGSNREVRRLLAKYQGVGRQSLNPVALGFS